MANSDPQASLQNLNTQIADLNNKCALTEELKSSLSALEQKVANLDPSLQNLNDKIADLAGTMEQIQFADQTESLKSALSSLEENVNSLGAEQKRVDEESLSIQQNLDTLKERIDTLTTIINQEDKIETLRASLEDLEKNVNATSVNLLDKIKEEINQVREEYTLQIEEAASVFAGISPEELAKKITPLEESIAQLTQKMNTQAANGILEEQLAATIRDKEALATKLATMEKRFEDLEHIFNTRIEKACASATARILREEIEALLAAQ